MPHREQAVVVPYSPEEMFDLVADVERYPEFVPGYREAKILRREGDNLVAYQRIGFGVVTAQFRSEATLQRPQSIQICSTERPFDSLRIQWRFEPVAQGCRVIFDARVRMNNGITAQLLQPWLDRLSEFVPPAFVSRAREHYGQREGPGPT